MICLSLTRPTLAQDLADLVAERSYIDAAELRADLLDLCELTSVADFARRVRGNAALGQLPLILTVRRVADGGGWDGTERDRRALLADAGRDYAFVDLEDDLFADGSASSIVADFSGRVIRSQHYFDGIPADPTAELRRMGCDGAIAKLAAMPRSVADLLALVRAARSTTELDRIVVGMGEQGFPTRVLARQLGSYVSFVSTGDRRAAPGHCTPRDLAELYRYHEVCRDAAVFAVIGNPVMHSQSPNYHNRVFAQRKLNAVYVPIHVDHVDALFELADELPISGCSVTIPHKQAVIAHLDQVDPAVRALGACNTVVREGDRWVGSNTDVEGFWRPLAARLGRRADGDQHGAPGNRQRALVIGAGGGARAVVYALAREGFSVVVANRTVSRAQALVDDLAAGELAHADLHAVALADLPTALGDIPGWGAGSPAVIVQSTSVGMHGNGDPVPLDFDGSEIVYDLVYTPPETPLIKRARAAGCITISGVEMFETQAQLQSERYCVAVP